MKLTRHLACLSTYRHHREFMQAAACPEVAQDQLWRDILSSIRGSTYWRQRLGTRARHLPLSEIDITEFSDYQAVLDEHFDSRISPLTGDPIIYWGKSSGTTSLHRKVFPYTRAAWDLTLKVRNARLYRLLRRFPGLLVRPIVQLLSAAPALHPVTGIPVGGVTASYVSRSAVFRLQNALPFESYRDDATLACWGPLYALSTDVTSFNAMSPLQLLAFTRPLCENLDALWPYLDGRKAVPSYLPPLVVSPERMAHLAAIRKRAAVLRFRDLWPALQCIELFKQGTHAQQMTLLALCLSPDLPAVDTLYGSTEGHIGVPLSSDRAGTVVHPGAVIIEALPLGDPSRPDGFCPAFAWSPARTTNSSSPAAWDLCATGSTTS